MNQKRKAGENKMMKQTLAIVAALAMTASAWAASPKLICGETGKELSKIDWSD
jgi:hypothetical protein